MAMAAAATITVSAIFGSRLIIPKHPSSSVALPKPEKVDLGFGNGGMKIECSSRPQKKATKHHMKTRPKKTNPSARRHGPPVYPPLPPLPSEWTLLSVDATVTVDVEPTSPDLVLAE